MRITKCNAIKVGFILFIFVLVLSSCGKMTETTNNERMVLKPVKEDPTISFRIWFKVGSQNDPAGKEGLAALTASLLTDAATKTNSYEQILEKLYPMAANIWALVDKEMTIITGRTHIDNLDDYYVLYHDAIMKPAFADDDFKRIKSQMLNYLENELRYSSDEELGKAALYEFIFDGTPYRHLAYGTIDGLNSITIEDVKEFYNKFYSKNNFVVGLGGGFPKELPSRIFDDLSKLPDAKIEEVAKAAPQKINGREVVLIDKKCDATAISFGFPIDIVRGDKDFFALFLFNSWFGEHRNQSSHLYQVIREKRGMNYGDYSYIETFLDGGSNSFPSPNNPRRKQIFEVWLRPVQHEHSHFALRAAIRELDNVIKNGITQEEFELTQNFLYNYALFYAQTTSQRLGYQIDSKFYGIDDGGDYIKFFRERIKKLTLNEVNAAIRMYIQSENMKIAIVTSDAQKFKTALSSDAFSTVSYVTPMSKDILEEDKIIGSYKLNISPEKIMIVKIDEMFQK